jgi:hypothetical protein
MSEDQRDLNPYASPSFVTTPSVEVVTRHEALRRLQTPAMALAFSSFGSLLWGVGSLLFGSELLLSSLLKNR